MSDDYSFVVAFVVTSSIWIYICIFRCTFRMSIDVSASLIFFVLITVPVISFFVVTCGFLSAAGGRGVLFSFRQSAYISFIIKAFIVFYYYHPLTAYIGYLHLPARASIRVVFFHNFISVFLFVELLPFFPLVTSLTWLRKDVH